MPPWDRRLWGAGLGWGGACLCQPRPALDWVAFQCRQECTQAGLEGCVGGDCSGAGQTRPQRSEAGIECRCPCRPAPSRDWVLDSACVGAFSSLSFLFNPTPLGRTNRTGGKDTRERPAHLDHRSLWSGAPAGIRWGWAPRWLTQLGPEERRPPAGLAPWGWGWGHLAWLLDMGVGA